MITDHKPLVAICKKDVASLSHKLQRCTIKNAPMQHKNVTQAWTTGNLLQTSYPDTTMGQKDREIPGICIKIKTVKSCMDISDCMTTEEIRNYTTR